MCNDYNRLLDKVMYSIETQDRIDARLQAAREHTTLVEQRELLIDLLRQMRDEFNRHTCKMHGPMVCDKCTLLTEVDNALATVEQEGEAR